MGVPSATPRQLYHNRGASACQAGPKSRKGSGRTAVFWAFGALFLISATIGQRAALVRSVPALGRVFALAGMPVAARGPLLLKLASRIDGASAQRLLTVEGEIANPGSRTVAVPGLRVSVKAADGREIYHWLAQPPKSSLLGGETISFRAKLADPPAQAQTVSLRFAAAEEGATAARDKLTGAKSTGLQAF